MSGRRVVVASVVAVTAIAATAVAGVGFSRGRDRDRDPPPSAAPRVAREWARLAVDVAQREGLSPPVAARLFGYVTLALHEASLMGESGSTSIARGVAGIGDLGPPPAGSDAPVAQVVAGANVLRAMVATPETARQVDEMRAAHLRSLPRATAAWRIRGETVARRLLERAAGDGYDKTLKMRYRITAGAGHWRPAPPGFGEPLEPHWGTLQPLLSPEVCPLGPPPAYDITEGSEFRTEVQTVVRMSRDGGDAARLTAQYWDDQPVFTATPPGHWMLIALAETDRAQLDEAATVSVITRVAMAMHDAMVSAWHWKFHYDVMRPVTVMRDAGDSVWTPYLNTPPFPEYPSGHSSVSMAAATVLTRFISIDGFTDSANQEALGVTRQYPSFVAAAQEAGLSRVLGGIHYPSGNVGGQEVGRCAAAKAIPL